MPLINELLLNKRLPLRLNPVPGGLTRIIINISADAVDN
jgi:hypothetical protein